ncbi:27 kDa antigen Cfp30B [Mycobacterium tuberculosis]|nr:27 kDa antigen Cfp30B [Mycobacterium tuberculosis]
MIGEAGSPVWHQLTTRDYRSVIDFYRQVFGWRTEQISDTDEFCYTTAWFDDQQLLGVMDGSSCLPEGVPSNWTIFFGADVSAGVMANRAAAWRAATRPCAVLVSQP